MPVKMDGGDGQIVLRCGKCNKPFDKQSSLKRHGYYCRSKDTGSTIRSRSCTECARGKVRCDKQWPGCSKCLAQGSECHYPVTMGNPKINDARHRPLSSIGNIASFSESGGDQNLPAFSLRTDVLSDSIATIPKTNWPSIGDVESAWSPQLIDFMGLFDPSADDTAIAYRSPGGLTTGHISTNPTSQMFPHPQTMSWPGMAVPQQPTYPTRSLVKRPYPKSSLQRTGELILHILRSYILMLKRPDNLPPFIHPHLMSPLSLENNYMETMTNCISLLRIINGVDSRGSRKLFWKNVRLECERLLVGSLQLNRWELLAATQALSIYTLIRLDEGETEDNNLDHLLVTTVMAIAKQLNVAVAADHEQSAIIGNALTRSWQDWIFEESQRRLCVIYQIVNMIFYFEPAAKCDHPDDLILAPLPQAKQLWEAEDQVRWDLELEKAPKALATFGVTVYGGLVKLGGDSMREVADWEEWCADMDGFGALIMLAASLTG